MRYTPETLLSYLTDPIDRVLLLQNPILPMPHVGTCRGSSPVSDGT